MQGGDGGKCAGGESRGFSSMARLYLHWRVPEAATLIDTAPHHQPIVRRRESEP
jgi:hypothetical protein